jgi:low density lipoprotein receptor-related protein 5/6
MSAIKRGLENGSQNGILVNSGLNANDQYSLLFDIALDPFSELLFWSCSATNTINATRLDNTSIGCIFEGKLLVKLLIFLFGSFWSL